MKLIKEAGRDSVVHEQRTENVSGLNSRDNAGVELD